MKNIKLTQYASLLLFLFGTFSCTNLDEEMFDRIGAGNYYQSKDAIIASLLRPYEHAHWAGWDGDRWIAQELTADHFVWTQKGKHGYDGGQWIRLHQHTWTPEEGVVFGVWSGLFGGVSLCNNTMQDIEALDYSQFNMTEAEKQAHLAEMRVLRAWFYVQLLDAFRNVPISTNTTDVVPQSNAQEVFNFIETELKEAAPALPTNTDVANITYTGRFTQAAAMTVLVRLYLNAEVYVGQSKYAECAAICQDILDGKYGPYSLDPAWNGPFTYTNDASSEMIFAFPQAMNQWEMSWMYNTAMHYNAYQILGTPNKFGGGWNGIHLTPSYDLEGNLYSESEGYEQGMPYEKFYEDDLRKQPFKYTGDGTYEGMFLIGPQYKLGTTDPVLGTEEYNGKQLVFVDQVGRFSEGDAGLQKGSAVNLGEENSGARLLKFPWFPDDTPYALDPDAPEIRLSEIYYSLAECKYRAGDVNGAAALLDAVRERAFPADKWASYSYSQGAITLNDAEFVDEWGREFLGERRRRTDLIRWNRFTNNAWWDKEPSAEHRKYFPIPFRALNANPLYKQNDGY
ncbi:Starch-binding associating with outer membrane [Catalinimonas alkaloidigena]|uniref:Starch-binding associating with outer membrane n=1 Tax=Catalinimonas alkaloidigena TaxID=1075417 RepID=A0A1G9PDT7_9BACT|nr:RagB/SusD family nutrient uptake outer membrane protein [Catalinimonas alkaloidigena]SDL96713.1 Starch-binding associating with outer membrane [Catalinimonas alkaloidigena]